MQSSAVNDAVTIPIHFTHNFCTIMKSLFKGASLFLALTFASFSLHAQSQKTVQVGGEAMYPLKNIVENAVN